MYFVKGDSKLDEFAEHTDNVSILTKRICLRRRCENNRKGGEPWLSMVRSRPRKLSGRCVNGSGEHSGAADPAKK